MCWASKLNDKYSFHGTVSALAKALCLIIALKYYYPHRYLFELPCESFLFLYLYIDQRTKTIYFGRPLRKHRKKAGYNDR